MIKRLRFTRSLALVAFVILMLTPGLGWGQLSIATTGTQYTIDFSASVAGISNGIYTGAGFQPAPTTGQLDSDGWAATGWSDGSLAFGGSKTTLDYARGNTAVAITTGGFYSCTGSPASASNPIFYLQIGNSDFEPGTLTLRVQNNSGVTLNQFDISYNIYVRNDQGRGSTFNFSYSTDDITYTSVSALNYTSPTTLDAAGLVIVGTAPSRSTSISSLSIANGSYFYIRWSSAAAGGSGSRDELGLDDIKITGSASSVNPTKLAITAVNSGNSPSTGTPYSVVVQSQDGSNIPANVAANTDFTLSVATGTGALGGTVTGSIAAGSNSATVTGVTYNTAEAGVSLTATRTAGDALSPGTSSTFTVLSAADHLAFVAVPSYGLVATNLNTFTVEARRADNTVDANFVSSISVAKASGPGNLTGTTPKTAVAGIATFNDLQLDATGAYTLTTSSGALTTATSGNIDILASLSYRSKTSGAWNLTGTWEAFNGSGWVDALEVPTNSGRDVLIQNGHAVNVPLSYNSGACKNLTIENGATLYANLSSGSCFVYVYGNILNDGTIGGATDVIGFDIEGVSCQISGSGTFIASRIAKFTTTNTTTSITFNQNVTLTYTSTSSAALRNGQAATTALNITLGAGKQLSVLNAPIDLAGCTLILKSDASGTASLLDNGAIAGTGIIGMNGTNVTVERFITGSTDLNAKKYHLVSKPFTTNYTANDWLGSYLFDCDEATGTWIPNGSATGSTLQATKGYMIYYPGASTLYAHTGTLQTATSTIPVTNTPASAYPGLNLVANMFPSALNFNAAASWAGTATISDKIWIWSSVAGNYGVYIRDDASGTNNVSNIIPEGQGFFVEALTSGNLTIAPTAKVHSSTQAYLKTGLVSENTLRIKASGNNFSDEIVVQFREDATTDYDNMIEAKKMVGQLEAPQLNSVAFDNTQLSINSLPFSEGDVIVPLNFALQANADVTFTATGMESFYMGVPVFLEDLALNTVTDLRSTPEYTFSHVSGSDENRFQLRFMGVTATPNQEEATQGSVFASNGYLYVDVPSMHQSATTITVYDALGRQLSSRKMVLNSVTQLPAPAATGVYIVRVTSGNKNFVGKVVVK